MNRLRIGSGIIFVFFGLSIIAGVSYINLARTRQPVFAANTMLDALWHTYKVNNLEASTGRTIDKSRDNLTTSEGESYTMLRAVWEDDRATFDKSLTFTNQNLRHKSGDALFAWQFGKRSDGTYGILTSQGGNNTAADGDQDIALALIFASQRWQNQGYLDQARTTVGDIWKHEVIGIGTQPIILADNLEAGSTGSVIVNPSYFSPAAYRIFAKIDSSHNWVGLADSSYTWLNRIAAAPALGTSSGLPPDWVSINRTSGAISAPPGPNLTTEYGYDAMRTTWHLALDYQWFKTPMAKTLITKLGAPLGQAWKQDGKLAAIINHDGTINQSYESPAIYGGDSGYFNVVDTGSYEAYFQTKLKTLYDANTQSWAHPMSYYDDNWAWFGLALHEKFLINLAP
jgi:endo-1,4-beta-D-glucanase Y